MDLDLNKLNLWRIKENLRNIRIRKILNNEDSMDFLTDILDDKDANKDLKNAVNSLIGDINNY